MIEQGIVGNQSPQLDYIRTNRALHEASLHEQSFLFSYEKTPNDHFFHLIIYSTFIHILRIVIVFVFLQ